MKRSDLNHLRRLVAWARCEIGQSPDELVTTMRNLAERGITNLAHRLPKAVRVERVVSPRTTERQWHLRITQYTRLTTAPRWN